jgi:hypothetical protein
MSFRRRNYLPDIFLGTDVSDSKEEQKTKKVGRKQKKQKKFSSKISSIVN